MWILLKPAMWSLLAALIPILGDFLLTMVNKAKPFVAQAAADQQFPSGEARHAFVVSQITPEVKKTGNAVLDQIFLTSLPLVTKIAYEQVKGQLNK